MSEFRHLTPKSCKRDYSMCQAVARVRAPNQAQFAIGFEGADEPISEALTWYDYASV
jgi:hypothetical protein